MKKNPMPKVVDIKNNRYQKWNSKMADVRMADESGR